MVLDSVRPATSGGRFPPSFPSWVRRGQGWSERALSFPLIYTAKLQKFSMQNNSFLQLFFIIFVFNISIIRAHARSAEFQNSAALSIRICNPFKKNSLAPRNGEYCNLIDWTIHRGRLQYSRFLPPSSHTILCCVCLIRYYAITLLHFAFGEISFPNLYIFYIIKYIIIYLII